MRHKHGEYVNASVCEFHRLSYLETSAFVSASRIIAARSIRLILSPSARIGATAAATPDTDAGREKQLKPTFLCVGVVAPL